MLKPGVRLKSAVCEAEIMVLKTSVDAQLECGGVPMSEKPERMSGEPEKMNGCLVGKRYVDEDEAIEVLCVKSGDGSLYLNGKELIIKAAKKLPSSD